MVDDSLFLRRLISRMLGTSPMIEVIGTAQNGLEAIEKTWELAPDCITMDVEMPVMNGLEAVGRIMRERPTPIIMLSTLTQEGAEVTLKALALGAVDFLPKPVAKPYMGTLELEKELQEKVLAYGTLRRDRLAAIPVPPSPPGTPTKATVHATRPAQTPAHTPGQAAVQAQAAPSLASSTAAVPPTSRALPPGGPQRLVVIGSSTGGPNALQRIIPHLPADFPSPLVVVQHMPVGFTRFLAERLNTISALEVREAREGDDLYPGTVFLAPAGTHLRIDSLRRIHLTTEPARHGVRPSVDITLETAATVAGKGAVGVLLTGMGSDGAEGMGLIKRAGGATIAQDEDSCVVYGMPKAAVELGYVDRVVSLDGIAAAITGAVA